MLEPNSPVTEEQLRQLQGLPVCIVMNDGARHFGLLTGCSKGKVVLNGDAEESAADIPSSKRTGRKPGQGRNGRRTGKRPAKTADRKTTADDGFAVVERPPYAEAEGWGYLGLGPPVSPFGPKVVLPIKPIDAVLLL